MNLVQYYNTRMEEYIGMYVCIWTCVHSCEYSFFFEQYCYKTFPYQLGNTSSCAVTEVKQPWVLGLYLDGRLLFICCLSSAAKRESLLDLMPVVGTESIMGRTHVSIKGQYLNVYLETHATTNHIYFIRLRILPRNLVHYTYWRVNDTLRGSSSIWFVSFGCIEPVI